MFSSWKGNTPHDLFRPAQRRTSQQSAVDWCDFWLNSHEHPDPAKANHYAHWRELRKLDEENRK